MSDLQTVLSLIGGKLVTNVGTLGAVSSKTWTVPANKRWIILIGYAERDQAATLYAKFTDSADKALGYTPSLAAATANVTWGLAGSEAGNAPSASRDMRLFGFMVLDAGMKVVITWGAAQTTPEVSLTVLEYEIA